MSKRHNWVWMMEYDGYGYFIFFLHFVAGFATFLVPKSRDANALWHLGTWFGSLTGDFGVPLSWFNFAEAILTLACSLGRFLKALRRVNANFARWTCVLPIFVGCFWRPEAVRLLQQAAASFFAVVGAGWGRCLPLVLGILAMYFRLHPTSVPARSLQKSKSRRGMC